MRVTKDDIAKLSLKLIEVFSRTGEKEANFGRYWRITAPLQTFSEHAVGPLEQEVAKMLLAAVEGRLKFHARNSSHPHAESASQLLRDPPIVYRRRARW